MAPITIGGGHKAYGVYINGGHGDRGTADARRGEPLLQPARRPVDVGGVFHERENVPVPSNRPPALIKR